MIGRRAQSAIAIVVALVILSAAAYVYLYPPLSGEEVASPQVIEPHEFSGVWYATHQLPTSYTEGCDCVAAKYTSTAAGDLRVTNYCVQPNNDTRVVRGVAEQVGNSSSQYAVQFEGLLSPKREFNILAVGEEYEWAMVGSSSRDSLWFLSRNSSLSSSAYQPMLEYASGLGYDVSRLKERENTACAALSG